MNDAFVETQAAGVSCPGEHSRGDCGEAVDPRLSAALRPCAQPPVRRKWLCRYLQSIQVRRQDAPDSNAGGKRLLDSAWTGLMRVLLSSNEFFYVD